MNILGHHQALHLNNNHRHEVRPGDLSIARQALTEDLLALRESYGESPEAEQVTRDLEMLETLKGENASEISFSCFTRCMQKRGAEGGLKVLAYGAALLAGVTTVSMLNSNPVGAATALLLGAGTTVGCQYAAHKFGEQAVEVARFTNRLFDYQDAFRYREQDPHAGVG